MKPRTLPVMARVVAGSVHGPADGLVTGVAVDSRTVERGDAFFALRGDRSDGHAYVGDALARGATAAVVRRGWTGAIDGGSLIEVEDPGRALLDLATDARGDLAATVVGITGSSGKTCTKDFTASVLSQRFRVVASRASFNNEVGLPLTILQAGSETEALVCEMGSRGRGHIEVLCRVARPGVGVVTNVGVAHMELFGSPDVLRDAKAELPESLPEDGVAVLNADDPVVRSFAARTPARRIVMYGNAPDAQVHAEAVDIGRSNGLAEFDLVTPDGSVRVKLPVAGAHMVSDALAAAAVGWASGVSLEATARGLAGARMSGGRMEATEAGGIRIVNDSYNANPASMASALSAARWMAGDGRCIAVLGYMAELGPIATAEHERVGSLVAELGVDLLIVVGEEARAIATGARRAGMDHDRIRLCEDVTHAVESVQHLGRPGDLVLVKASRVARLERIVEALLRGESSDKPRPSPEPQVRGAAP
jgi:UDP-N-acetylmuramoyl-tripeptide--D-alanyl-D-alanine ligase